MIELLGIHSCENVRDRDMLRASCYAIAAGGAGNQMFAAEYLYNLIDSSETGIRTAFYGGDGATVRDTLVSAVQTYIDEFNAQVEAME